MRIQPIINSNIQINQQIKNNKAQVKAAPRNVHSDTCSFKGYEVTLTLLVAKEGYKSLKTASEKGKFYNEIVERFINPNVSEGPKHVMDTLYALAKYPAKEEPTSLFYDMSKKDTPGHHYTIGDMRIKSMKKLFPLLDDTNPACQTAKIALMESLVDTGEYFEHFNDFYEGFKSLPLIYKNNKMALLQKLLYNRNVQLARANIAKTKSEDDAGYVVSDMNSKKSAEEGESSMNFLQFCGFLIFSPVFIYKEREKERKVMLEMLPNYIKNIEISSAAANTALLSTLDPNEYYEFFNQHDTKIKEQASTAFYNLERRLIGEKSSGNAEKNRFYEWYESNFTTIGYTYSADKEHYENYELHKDMMECEQILARKYFLDFMKHFDGDKSAIMEQFNIDEAYCEDLCKDYEVLVKTKMITDDNELKELYQKRIDEKLSSNDIQINVSYKTLLTLSGKQEMYEDLKTYATNKLNPQSQNSSSAKYYSDYYDDYSHDTGFTFDML